MTDLKAYIQEKKELVQQELKNQLTKLDIPEILKKSMLYSVEAGGKRLRPILLIASYEAFGQRKEEVFPTAVALEMIHTYSLIHDDLPSMDNDDFRRGKPTNHKIFDEATAILAGDALLTYSFEIVGGEAGLTDEQRYHLSRMLAKVSGPSGMVGGQLLDMEAEDRPVTLEELERIHTLKTGELVRFAVYAGAYIAGADAKQLAALEKFAYYLGLIFQVQDDILDVTGDQEKLGKPVGSDEENQKSTYPKLLGLDGAQARKNQYVAEAKKALEHAGAEGSILMELTDYFSNRDH
ncbi:polyprenyl synthetase family protein [Oceanobacillus kapialis]|uniref:Polyprenyl synthetase family protein n=1 Tax=Oceanobacillus kapialis TaxID=481353 RepID=A0ABW5Q550_9BACI